MSETRLRVRIEGRVQGVGFRWWTAQRARETGVRGTVCNRPDGSVEAHVAGPAAAVAAFRSALDAGPSAARVDRIIELPPHAEPLPEGFTIVRG